MSKIRANRKVMIFLLLLFGLSQVLNKFVFEVYTIFHDSMNGTLRAGDKIIVSKINRQQPARNDIILFSMNGTTYVKRCIGMPGDTIQIVEGMIKINNRIVANPIACLNNFMNEPKVNLMTFNYYNINWNRLNFGPLIIPKRGMEISLNDPALRVYENTIKEEQRRNHSTPDPGKNTGTYTITDNYFFVIGDNRPVSEDSRTGIGLISQKQLLGKSSMFLYTNGNNRRIFSKIE